jgi:hypothetical protein
MVGANVDEVLAAVERFDPAAPWGVTGPLVLPLLPRLRPYPIPLTDRITVTLPPGIEVAFGVDLGPAVAFVVDRQLDGWGIDRAVLVAAALDNVRRIAETIPPSKVLRMTLDGVPARVLQSGRAVASTLLLVPDTLPGLIGRGPNLVLAPMRDVLVALPADVDRAYAEDLAAGLAHMDPNGLDLGLFRHDGDRVVREAAVTAAGASGGSVVRVMH